MVDNQLSRNLGKLSMNQEIIFEISGINHQGEGVGRHNGIAVFVAGTIPGEKVRGKIIEVRKNFARAKVLKVEVPSGCRKVEECTHHAFCGGCQFQHMSYEEQLRTKTNLVKDAFDRIAKLNTTVKPTIGMEEPRNYRNKVHFQVGEAKGRVVLGFFGEDNFKPSRVDECLLVDKSINKIAKAVEGLLNDYAIKPFNWKTKEGLIRHVVIRKSAFTGETMVVFVSAKPISKAAPNALQQIAEKLLAGKGVSSVILNINPIGTRQVFGRDFKLLGGQNRIKERIGSLQFSLSAPAFFQVNPKQTEVLYNKALQYCELKGTEEVIDAYCGTGTISLFVAQKASKVVGIETVKEAIDDAKLNADLNDVKNAEFITGRVEEVLPKLVGEGFKADVVVLDPPRKGCEPEVIKAIGEIKPQRVVYVSCDPTTLARDCRLLAELGYEVKEVQPVDMFPWTSHVECVVLIELKNKCEKRQRSGCECC